VKFPFNIILASASPRRVALLKKAGIEFTQIIPDIEEQREMEGGPVHQVAVQNALLKAQTVSRKHPDALVIGGDTIVISSQGEILGKPDTEEEAFRILSNLSGTTHSVVTGVAVLYPPMNISETFYEETGVTMKNMGNKEIDQYIESGEPFGKAGAYAIQENADKFVERIEGDFDNVVGLPVEKVISAINKIAASI
jgi:septum formation protein